jgi:hypothetical protein
VNRAVPHDPPPILPQAMRRPVAIVAVLAALVVLTLALTFTGDSAPASFDRAVQPGLESSATAYSAWARAVHVAGHPGGLAVLVALLVGVSLLRRRSRVAVLVVLGTGLSISVTSALKPLVGRTIHGIDLSYPKRPHGVGDRAGHDRRAARVAPPEPGRRTGAAVRGRACGRRGRCMVRSGPGVPLTVGHRGRLVHGAGGGSCDSVARRPCGRPVVGQAKRRNTGLTRRSPSHDVRFLASSMSR